MRRAGAVLAAVAGIAALAFALWVAAILVGLDAATYEPGALLLPVIGAAVGVGALWFAVRLWRTARTGDVGA